MRIPYRIDPLVLSLYQRSQETSDLISEQGILIDAQDLEWDNDEIPTLVDLCVKKIAFYFDEHPWYYQVPCADRDYLLELLSLDLDLELTIPLLKSEYYWERRYDKHFGTIIIPKPNVWTWKSLYIERETQRMIEEAQPSSKDEEKLESILKLCTPYVKRLIVSQLQMWRPPLACNPDTIPEIWPIDHIDFTWILPHLPLIEELDIVFGQNHVDFGFHWNMFKVTVLDCQRLGKAILSLPNLTLLRIHKSMIEDKQCQALMQSLVENKTIVELHLPNCDIGDEGCLCLAKFLLECPTLKILNLSNNRIHERGTVGLAYSLLQPHCPPLVSLFLTLNPLGREGVVGIMRALVRCTLPEELYISAVQFSGDVIERIAQMITNNNSLKVLDMSSNYFGEIGGKMLIDAMGVNTCLEWVDMRETGIPEEQCTAITRLLKRNRGVPLDVEDDADDMEFELSDDGKQGDEDEDEL